MITDITITMKCNRCSKTFSISGPKSTLFGLYKAGAAKGWKRVSGGVQFCPDHAKIEKPVKTTSKKDGKKTGKGTYSVIGKV